MYFGVGVVSDGGCHPLNELFRKLKDGLAYVGIGSEIVLAAPQQSPHHFYPFFRYGVLANFGSSDDPGHDLDQHALIEGEGSEDHGIFDEPQHVKLLDHGRVLVLEYLCGDMETSEDGLAEWKRSYMVALAILKEKASILVM